MVVNKAGILGGSMADDMLKSQDYEDTTKVNVIGVVRVTQVFRQIIKKSLSSLA